jgi:hypothetical protein
MPQETSSGSCDCGLRCCGLRLRFAGRPEVCATLHPTLHPPHSPCVPSRSNLLSAPWICPTGPLKPCAWPCGLCPCVRPQGSPGRGGPAQGWWDGPICPIISGQCLQESCAASSHPSPPWSWLPALFRPHPLRLHFPPLSRPLCLPYRAIPFPMSLFLL